MSLDPKLVSLLQKLEADDLADLASLLVPAVFAEAQDLLPASVAPYASIVLAALQSPAQQALASLVAKIPAA